MGWGALRRGKIGAACATIACAAALLTPSSALAVFNPLAGSDGCLWASTPVASDCGDAQIRYLEDLAIDPSGSDVYVTNGSGIVRRYDRSPVTGGLTPTSDCWTSGDGSDGCTPALGIRYAEAIEISPDGLFVYVAGENRTIARFQRDPATGMLTQSAAPDACWGGYYTGCTLVRGLGYNYAYDLEITGDGTGLIASTYYGPITSFQRDTMTGRLTQAASPDVCWGDWDTDEDGQSCRFLPSDPYLFQDAASTSDGRFVYAAAEDTLHAFERDPATGELTHLACIGYWTYDDPAWCSNEEPAGASGAQSVALSDDDAFLYVGGWDSVMTYAVNPTTGALTQLAGTAGCRSDYRVLPARCTRVRGHNGANDIKLSPDGLTAYVSTYNALELFDRDAVTGELTQRAGQRGCMTVELSVATNDGCQMVGNEEASWHLAPSPDGANLYAIGGNGLLTFGNPGASCRDVTTPTVINDVASKVTLGCVGLDPDLRSMSVVTPPAHGTLGAVDQVTGVVEYTPDVGWVGTDTFTYGATDGIATTAAATVTITSRARALPVQVTAATLGGIERVGEVMSVTGGSWTSAIGSAWQYQEWYVCDTTLASCSFYSTGTTWRIPALAVNRRVKVVTKGYNADGTTTGVTLATGVIAQSAGPKLISSYLYGSAVSGYSLRDDTSWFTAGSLTYTRVWERCDLTLTSCTTTPVTTQSYPLGAADVGSKLRLSITVTDQYGSASTTVVSNEILATAPAPTYTYLEAPTISGSALVGSTLTATPGVLRNATATSSDYQWRRCDESGFPCEDIPGETTTTYVITAADHGSSLQFFQRTHYGVDRFRWNTSASTDEVRDPAEVGTMAPVVSTPPSISGTIAVSRYAYGDEGDWTGVDPFTFASQWLRCDAAGANCVPIGGTSAWTYYIGFADAGGTLRLQVTATNADGTATATSTAVAVPHPPAQNSGIPSISTGWAAEEGATISTTNGTWNSTTPITSWRYEFWRCAARTSGAPDGTCTLLADSASNSLTLTAADIDSNIGARVFATNSGGEAGSYWVWTSTVVPAPPVSLGAGSVTGSATQGQTLTYAPGTWSASRPFTTSTVWERCRPDGTACSVISGTTNSPTYVVSAADEYRTLRVQESARAVGELSSRVVSTPSPPSAVVPLEAPHSSATPYIAPNPQVGWSTSTSSSWTTPFPATLTTTQQWLRCDASGNGCVPIAGATQQWYLPVAADVDMTLRATHVATNAAGSTTVTSGASSPVRPPVPTGTSSIPVVTGALREGQTLSTTTGTFNVLGAATYAYQWTACMTGSPYTCTDIPGATSATHTLSAADIGMSVRARVTVTNAAGSDSMTSQWGQAVVPIAPSPAATPSVSGSAQVGSTLAFSGTAWTSSVPVTEYVTWQSCAADGSDCRGVGWSATFDLTSAQLGRRMRVAVIGRNAGGDGVVYSAMTAVVVGAPDFDSGPTLLGSGRPGSTLTVDPGLVGTAPMQVTYTWLRCDLSGLPCEAISGAAGNAYVPTTSDSYHLVRARVSASNAYGSRVRETSSIQVALGGPELRSAGRIEGTTSVGSVLTWRRPTWYLADTVQMTWERCKAGGVDCQSMGVNGPELTLQEFDEGAWVRVREYASNAAGFTTTISALVGPVVVDPALLPTAKVTVSALTQRALARFRWTEIPGAGTVASWELSEQRWSIRSATRSSRTITSQSTELESSIAAGETVCLQLRAVLMTNARGPWSAQACTSAPVPASSLRAIGRWSRLGSSRTTRLRGAALDISTRPRVNRLTIIGRRCPTCGTVEIVAGGRVVQRLSMAGRTGMRTWRLPQLAHAVSGTIRVRVTTRGRPVTITGIALAPVTR
jgi:hypothetical protein